MPAGVGRRQSFSSPAFWGMHRQLSLFPCSGHAREWGAPGKQGQPQTRTVLPEQDTASPSNTHTCWESFPTGQTPAVCWHQRQKERGDSQELLLRPAHPSANSRATLPRAAPPLSLSPGEREGTDLHGFEGGDEREHDVVARPARAGQQRTAPAEREESRERLRMGANSRGWLWGHAGTAQTARGHSWGTENCISAQICQQFPSRRAERT